MTESTQVRHTSCPSLTSHSAIHNDLLMYRDLMKWLKECQPGIFSEVMDVSIFCHSFYVSCALKLTVLCESFSSCLRGATKRTTER